MVKLELIQFNLESRSWTAFICSRGRQWKKKTFHIKNGTNWSHRPLTTLILEALLIHSTTTHPSTFSNTYAPVFTHSSVQLLVYGALASLCQICDKRWSIVSFASTYALHADLEALKACAARCLPLIWINHRWPYAATEEWAKPWLAEPC